MKLLSQNQLHCINRFVCIAHRCRHVKKLPGFHICMIKAWSHIFARFSENENHSGSVRRSPIIVIQSDSEPTVDRLLDVAFLSNVAVLNCGLIPSYSVLSDSTARPKKSKKKQKTETQGDMGDSSDSEEFEITDLVHQFMAVTGAEDTVALSYLQQSSWNVEVCRVFFANISASPYSNHQNLFVQFLDLSVRD